MITFVNSIEKNYWDFAERAREMAYLENFTFRDSDELSGLWNQWRDRHTSLVEAYENIKQNSRMGKLFRPARESRWGTLVPITSVTVERQFLMPRGTVARRQP